MTGENIAKEVSSNDIEPDVARSIIDHQVTLLIQLNDELLRTIRVHAIFGGVIITGISFLGDSALSIHNSSGQIKVGSAMWASFAVLFGFLWLIRLAWSRISYTDLRLSSNPDGEGKPRNSDLNLSFFAALRVTFIPIKPSWIETKFEKENVRREVFGSDFADCIEHNNWILKTREGYVNSVQMGLNTSFVLTVLCLIGIAVN
ncbi:hypothetical protein [Salinarchaeum sp. Harcht-Bsk1]|uniref:hypothetical protein n=1 Tax=Salinarchaeum sp. Harcht-Bsk1 TaxID=1333523 RepID=UPI001181C73B|nr:hypothetical protein [Salinarchaeum sp. Harcht-Bsk1]